MPGISCAVSVLRGHSAIQVDVQPEKLWRALILHVSYKIMFFSLSSYLVRLVYYYNLYFTDQTKT